MKRIPLTQGKVALVDHEDFEWLNQFSWRASRGKDTSSFYAVRWSPRIKGKRRQIYMHRELMKAESSAKVDHENHDTLDNRKGNLRVCSSMQNSANQRKRINNSSGFKGVGWNKRAKKWRARITVANKEKTIGYYLTSKEAASAYDAVAIKRHGRFALTNKMLGLLP